MAQWRNKINIKHMFNNDGEDQTVLKICDVLVPQLEKIYKKDRELLENQSLDSSCEDILYDLMQTIEDFKFVKHCIENQDDPGEYEFDNWTEAFDCYLRKLYDLGDTIVTKRQWHNDEKFLWVE